MTKQGDPENQTANRRTLQAIPVADCWRALRAATAAVSASFVCAFGGAHPRA